MSLAHQALAAQASLVHQASARVRLPLFVVVPLQQPARLKVLLLLLPLPLRTLVLPLPRAPWLASSPLALLLLFCKQSMSMMGNDGMFLFLLQPSNAERNSTTFRKVYVNYSAIPLEEFNLIGI